MRLSRFHSRLQFVVRNNDWFSGGGGNSGGVTADDVMIDADIAESGNNSRAAVIVDSPSQGIDNTVGYRVQSCTVTF